ncbi:MAG: hypothetical protein ACT4QG_06395 [Sporichthyaceae bacterium]
MAPTGLHAARRPVARDRTELSAPRLSLLASASAASGAIHVAVIPAHADWVAGASFFAAVATFQLGWAIHLLRRATPAALRFAVAVNAGVLVLWLFSRTTGMPLGPHPGIPEEFGRSDVLAAGLQVAVIAAALWTLARPGRFARRTRVPALLGALGVSAVMSALAVAGIGSASEHRHGHRTQPTAIESPADSASDHTVPHAR